MRKIATGIVLCGMTILLSSCTLHLGDVNVQLPWWVMTILVVIPSLLIATFFIWCSVRHNAKATYVCSHCQHRFKAGWKVLYSLHVNDDYVLKCPSCGKRDFCHMSYDQET